MSGLPRAVRGAAIILVALAALLAGAGHVLLPSSAPKPSPHATRVPTAAVVSGRLVGTANIDGDTFVSPRLAVDEPALLHALIVRGVDIERVDPAPWSQQFDQAVADVVTTDQDQLFVFAPEAPGHPRWVCPAEVEGAIIGGGDLPSYEIGIGGEREVVQIDARELRFWTLGELIVATPTAHAAAIVGSFAEPAACPVGQ